MPNSLSNHQLILSASNPNSGNILKSYGGSLSNNLNKNMTVNAVTNVLDSSLSINKPYPKVGLLEIMLKNLVISYNVFCYIPVTPFNVNEIFTKSNESTFSHHLLNEIQLLNSERYFSVFLQIRYI